MAAFPNIRAPSRESWRGGAPDGVRRTPMETGPVKKIVESTATPAVESFQFKLSVAHFELLDVFYRDNKALRFDLDHWIWGEVEAGFAGPPDYGHQGRWLIANVRLEIFR